jgi:hypothetical protein
MEEINFESCSENKEVVKLLKEKYELEQKIKRLDEFALILLEYQLLGLN